MDEGNGEEEDGQKKGIEQKDGTQEDGIDEEEEAERKEECGEGRDGLQRRRRRWKKTFGQMAMTGCR